MYIVRKHMVNSKSIALTSDSYKSSEGEDLQRKASLYMSHITDMSHCIKGTQRVNRGGETRPSKNHSAISSEILVMSQQAIVATLKRKTNATSLGCQDWLLKFQHNRAQQRCSGGSGGVPV
jgi:hypothetical protein